MSGTPRRRRRGIPLGTDLGIFIREQERVVVSLFMSDPIELEYEDDKYAEAACLELKDRLLEGAEETAVALRKRYSASNLLDFLSVHVEVEGLIAVRFTTAISVSGDGLLCRLPAGEWFRTHVENLSNPHFTSFSRRPTVRLKPLARYLYDHFQLDRAYTHEGHARASFSFREFFGWDE